MGRNIQGRERIVMATVGSYGDVHPYVALALEMKERGLTPVIVTSEANRKKIEALGIEFHPMRPAFPDMDTPEGVEIIDKVVDLKHGAEYLFREMLVPAVRDRDVHFHNIHAKTHERLHVSDVCTKEQAPVGCETVYVNTWACGRLKPGAQKTFVWNVTAVDAGHRERQVADRRTNPHLIPPCRISSITCTAA